MKNDTILFIGFVLAWGSGLAGMFHLNPTLTPGEGFILMWLASFAMWSMNRERRR